MMPAWTKGLKSSLHGAHILTKSLTFDKQCFPRLRKNSSCTQGGFPYLVSALLVNLDGLDHRALLAPLYPRNHSK